MIIVEYKNVINIMNLKVEEDLEEYVCLFERVDGEEGYWLNIVFN